MLIKLQNFVGVAPAVDERRLGEQYGTVARDIDFESGALAPTENHSDVTTLGTSTKQSIYYYNHTNWLQWEEQVDVAKGPVPNDAFDRLYWTGEDYPRVGTSASMISGSVYPNASFKLGIPAPAAAPTVVKSGTADDTQTPFDVSYVFTFVSAIGEEGPPSAATPPIALTDSESVAITMGATPSGNYNFGTGALRRIYRSNTGSTNTQFQFVGEVPITTTSFTDTKDGDELGEILPSETWIGPPDDDSTLYPSGPMLGLINLSNGIMAGFTGNRLCFSEPFLPHAWPVAYRITLDDDIVGIAPSGNGVAVMTEGRPYFVTGVDPSSMSAIKLNIQQSCISKDSIVDMGDYVLYASPDGLVAITGNTAQLVTKGLISPQDWVAGADSSTTDTPFGAGESTFRAFRYENSYVGFQSGTDHIGWVYTPGEADIAISTQTRSARVRGGFEDKKNGLLYFIEGNQIKKYQGGTSKNTLRFKSKVFNLTRPASFSWIHVDAEAYPVTVKVIADGTTIADYTISKSGDTYTQTVTTPTGTVNPTLQEPIMRLPAEVGREWQIQIDSANRVNEVSMATSIEELKQS